MNKTVLSIVAVVGVLVMGGGTYLLARSDDSSIVPDNRAGSASTAQTSGQNASSPDLSSDASSTAGTYVDYSATVIADTSGTKLLFFHAPWCPQCRALEADIKEQGVPTGTTIIKVDYDNSQSLRQKYGVTLQTTVVRVDDNGDLVKKFVAYDDPSVDAIKQNLL